MESHRALPCRAALLLGLAFVCAACGAATGTLARFEGAAATPAPSQAAPNASGSAGQSDQAVYAQIERQVEALRDLRTTSTVTPVLLDSKGVADWLAKANAEQTDHLAMANESRLFADLGLIPKGSSLEQMELDLAAGQVVGFYDPVSKGLYVLSQSGGVGPTQKLTFSHEYTHALQDQDFGLEKRLVINTPGQSDRDLARTALPEGDATLVMTQWSAQNLSVGELLQIAGESFGGPQAAQLASAPQILSQTLTFPYDQGLAFVRGVYVKGGWAAVDALYTHPPDSTSQILHPELYAGGVEPVPVTVPPVPAALGVGWKLTMQDTLGELELGIWLEGPKPTDAAISAGQSAVSAWGGDRVGLYEGPNGAWAVVIATTWRTAAGARAFDAAAGSALAGLSSPSRSCSSGADVSIVVASDQAFLPEMGVC